MQKGILFTGSSSNRFWKDPTKDLKNDSILNRSFGGSKIKGLIEKFNQDILKFQQKNISHLFWQQ
ncbi:hypothetical protein [Changchengzhania lutea]|uniref:hypothetical protein n=1 Tax=Changchengzhania lutea TaxID=2049305 RepID=UPI001C8F6CF6|nr:hypothetical protein [Changchengzhania lutea]